MSKRDKFPSDDSDLIVEDSEDLDELSTENDDDEPDVQVPSKFKGKSVEDIINSYTNLEKEFSRQGNELGELRKLTDTFLQKEIESSRHKKEDAGSSDTLTEDDFIKNPIDAVTKIVEQAVRPIKENLANTSRSAEVQKFEQKHPDYATIVSDSEFQQWVLASPTRVRLWEQATNSGVVDNADELITTYKQLNGIKTKSSSTSRKEEGDDEALKVAASVSKGGAAADSGRKKIYRRTEIIRLRQTDPQRYAALLPEIKQAYAENRVR